MDQQLMVIYILYNILYLNNYIEIYLSLFTEIFLYFQDSYLLP